MEWIDSLPWTEGSRVAMGGEKTARVDSRTFTWALGLSMGSWFCVLATLSFLPSFFPYFLLPSFLCNIFQLFLLKYIFLYL